MDTISKLVTRVSEYLELDTQLVALAMLLLFGAAAHLVLGVVVRRLHRAAIDSAQRWDDILITSLETPIRVVLWVLVAYLALEVYPLATGLQNSLVQAYDTALVFLLAWFLHRLSAESRPNV